MTLSQLISVANAVQNIDSKAFAYKQNLVNENEIQDHSYNIRISKIESKLQKLEETLTFYHDFINKYKPSIINNNNSNNTNVIKMSKNLFNKIANKTSFNENNSFNSISKQNTTVRLIQKSKNNNNQNENKKFQPIMPKSDFISIANGNKCPINIHSCLNKMQGLTKLCKLIGFEYFEFQKVSSDYYEKSLNERKLALNALSESQLCKSIIMENIRWSPSDKLTETENPRYICVIVQYIHKLNSDKLNRSCQLLSNKKLSKNKINFRLCSENDNYKLSGFCHNAVTPFGMNYNMPIVLSHSILLDTEYFYLGAGEIDLKIKFNTKEFIEKMDCLVAEIAN